MTIIGYDVADVIWGVPQGYGGCYYDFGFCGFPFLIFER